MEFLRRYNRFFIAGTYRFGIDRALPFRAGGEGSGEASSELDEMNIRPWQDVMRDIQADWKDWSPGERIAATALLLMASLAIVSIFILHV